MREDKDDLMYDKLPLISDYLSFSLDLKRRKSFRLHVSNEMIPDDNGDDHSFDVTWYEATGELVAVEVEESLGTVLPIRFKLKRGTDKYLFLGVFTEKGVDDLRKKHEGGIVEYLWSMYTEGEMGSSEYEVGGSV